jgi:putative SOS response-associated peptidase YedK
MCGRYELHTHPAALALAFGLAAPPDLAPRYNIAPTQQVPIVRQNAVGTRELVEVRWGLVPRWAKDPSIGARLINARAETAAERPAFSNAFRRHRCLLPADGFYEWKTTQQGKQPVRVAMKNGEPLGLAGLYERWLAPDGEVLDSCTILTTPANALLAGVHDRMPVIIAPQDYARWLDPAANEVADLLAPYPAEAMTWYPISMRVNAVRNDDATLIEHIADAPQPAAENEVLAADAPPLKKPVQTRLL